MTEPTVSETAELIAAVRELNATTASNAVAVAELRERTRRDRLLIFVTMVGLALDLILSGVVLYQHVQQVHTNHSLSCQNRQEAERQQTSEDFLRAEIRKVQGQVAGLNLLAADPHAGLAKFTVASENYLTYVNHRLALLNDSKAVVC